MTQGNDLIVGVGSPHGDDAAGWLFVERISPRLPLGVGAATIDETTRLLPHLEGCRRLWLVDACISGHPVGTISRYRWPAVDEIRRGGRSTHGIGIVEALRLGEQLGRLPELVVIYTVEIGQPPRPGEAISAVVAGSLASLEVKLLAELQSSPKTNPARYAKTDN